MSELDAVNLILKNLQEAPVNTLSGELPLDASQALVTLTEISHEVQKRGWYFNTEYFRLAPNVNKEIPLPASTLSVTTTGSSKGTPVQMRQGKLYNMTPFQSGFRFETPVELKLTLGLEFDDLPPSARSYIAHRAARVTAVRELGDQLTYKEDLDDETRAYAELHAEQLRHQPVSLAQSPSVASVVYPTGSN
ncbi:hypothetical protein [Maritalea mediterranea]|uniref:Tail tubular protein A n=1 Tax=Maritalea mediterranea TaxID=2909667 RepID=A0ABS9EA99_9HYPH|nr:hypothetical protein [Maritalea mediterranea]MCF4099788.1 hypothetical protein [Maritalea mediterranea]